MITIPPEIRALVTAGKLIDCHYSNDSAHKFFIVGSGSLEDETGHYLWVDHENPADRLENPSAKRFTIQPMQNNPYQDGELEIEEMSVLFHELDEGFGIEATPGYYDTAPECHKCGLRSDCTCENPGFTCQFCGQAKTEDDFFGPVEHEAGRLACCNACFEHVADRTDKCLRAKDGLEWVVTDGFGSYARTVHSQNQTYLIYQHLISEANTYDDLQEAQEVAKKINGTAIAVAVAI